MPGSRKFHNFSGLSEFPKLWRAGHRASKSPKINGLAYQPKDTPARLVTTPSSVPTPTPP